MADEHAPRVVLLTGATGGIGGATAETLAGRGACLALHYHRNGSGAEALQRRLPGGPHRVFAADLAEPHAAAKLVDRVVREMGALDVAVNNAGIGAPRRVLDLSFEEWVTTWRRAVDTNLLGAAHVAFCAAKHMAEQGGGRIVNVSSRGAFRGEPEQPWYGASKAGLNAMGQSLAQALAPSGIYVYTVAPGFVETAKTAAVLEGPRGAAIRAQSPFERVATAQEVADVVAYLATAAPAFMTGAIVDLNGASYLRS